MQPSKFRRHEPTTAHLSVLGPTPHLAAGGTGPGGPGAQPLLAPSKPFAALCLLALEPEGVSREALAGYLWPDAPPERARASARQALYIVRRALGSDAVTESDGHVTLLPGAVDTDLAALHATLAAGDLEGAHSLWRGGPFAHFSLADAPGFNHWADRVRGRWERRLGDALARRAAMERENGHDEEALVWLGRVLDVRPLDDAAHALRVELLLELGFLDQADAALERARTVADDATSGHLDELAARLRTLRRAAAPEATEAPSIRYPALRFVGRKAEIAMLRAHWRSALAGQPRSVAVLGEAGIGKSRLAEEWVRHTPDTETIVVQAKALDSERVLPLGLAAELAKGLAALPGAAGIASSSLGVLRHLVPTLGRSSGPVPSGSLSEVAVADALEDLVDAVAGEAPLVLWIEQLQWADPLSRAVILRLARSLRHVQVLTLVTCRSGDADPAAAGILRAEGEAGRFTVLELEPLTPAEVSETLELSLDVQPPEEAGRTASRLAAVSEGNPLFLSELLLRLHAEGRITVESRRWVLHAARVGPDLPLPTSVREILRARLEALRPEHHPVLGALAYAARSLTAEELAHLTEAPLPAVRAALHALSAQGILERDPVAPESEAFAFHSDSLHGIAREMFLPPAPRAAARRRRYLWIPAAGAVALAAVLTGLWLDRSVPSPLHPGVIYASEAGVVRRFRMPVAKGHSWDTLSALPVPGDVSAVVLAPRTDLEVDAFGVALSPEGTRRLLRRSHAGAWEALSAADGDVTPVGRSPDGRYLLLLVGGSPGGSYRQTLVRYDLESGDTLVLYRADERVGAAWWPDGSAVVARVRAAEDTVLLLRPDGVELERRVGTAQGYPGAPALCGPDGSTLLEVTWDGDVAHLVSWSWKNDERQEVWTVALPVVTPFQCSPDGSAAVSVARLRGQNRVLVVELATGDTLLGPELLDVDGIGWIPDRAPPVPVRVAMEADSVVLGWGESRSVRATVHLGDGTRSGPYPLAWRSLDPAVASVRDGVLYANGVGTTAVLALAQGWIADTLRVRVTGAALPVHALLADAFATFDTALWVPFGGAAPVPARTDDGPALELRGADVRSDGIYGRDAFDLSRGGTLEASFRLPLTRRDRQGVAICLRSGSPPGAGNPRLTRWMREELCFTHPAGTGARFDPSSFHFLGLSYNGNLQRTPLLPAQEWVRVSIVLSPDGEARLLLDQQETARLPWPVDNGPHHRWYVSVSAASVDTRLLLRDVVLWEGMRY